MKLAEFKKHFYNYISKKDYITAITAIAGSLATTFANGYSSYLSDRNDRIRRLNKTPINHIMIDFITYEEYERRINPANWKPANQRPIEEDTSYKNDGFSGYLRHWLLQQKTKKRAEYYEINEESLQALIAENAEYNNQFGKNDTTIIKQQQKDLSNNQSINIKQTQLDKINKKKAQTRFEKSISKIGELSHSTDNGNLPPSLKKIEKTKYFVVRDGDGITNDPLKLRLQKGKQNIKTPSNMKQSIGTIGGQDIKKDETIFDTIGYIFKKILHITDGPQYQIIDSRYDQYGNRIKDAEYLERKRKTKEKMTKLKEEKRKKREAKATNTRNNEPNTSQDSEENQQNNILEQINFVIPTFKIDGNLQNMNSYQTLQNISTDNNISTHEKKVMAFLEYQYERCLYQILKKYVDTGFSITIQLDYNDNAELQKMKILKKITNDMPNDFAVYQKEVVRNLQTCSIVNNNYINKNNYSVWGVVKLTISQPINNDV